MKIERKNDLSLRLLEIFDAVMRRRTTVDAAADLGISQPAVSNAIKALEKQLGLVLFERTRRQLLPTEEARRLLREIEPLFGMLQNVKEEVRDLRHARSGRLRMISTPPLGHTVVPHALKRFLKERPKVRVNYDIRRLETVIQSVETGAAEIGFVLGVRHHPGLTVTQLHVGEMVCVTPADHPLAGKEKITPADITSHRLIGLETSLGASVRSAFDTAGVPYMSDVQVRYCHTACVLANAGIGVAVVDPWSAKFTQAQEIVTRPFSPSTQVVAAAIHRKDTTWSLLAEALVRELHSQFLLEPKYGSRQE